jgi:hypothetical protein
MMLKPQDIVILIKLLAHRDHLDWSQHRLAMQLCLSPSAINASLVRLNSSGLVNLGVSEQRYQLVIEACEEILIFGVKYFFPAELGEYTSGIATSYAAPIFSGQISVGQDPIPVWPSAEGMQKGIALEPLYHCVPKALIHYPDQAFYDLLALVDAMRSGRARERNLAVKFLKARLSIFRDNFGDKSS